MDPGYQLGVEVLQRLNLTGCRGVSLQLNECPLRDVPVNLPVFVQACQVRVQCEETRPEAISLAALRPVVLGQLPERQHACRREIRELG